MKSTLISRVRRLEAVQQRKHADVPYREAWIVMGDFDGERHLEMTCCDRGRCWFEERPGPGPQISDFGTFVFVAGMTRDEADA